MNDDKPMRRDQQGDREDAPVTIPPPDFTPPRQPGRDVRITAGTVAALFLAALGLILVLAALRELVSIILLVLLAITIALGIMPAVDRLEKFKVPRALGVVLMYVAILGGLSVLIFFTVRPLATELRGLSDNAPTLARNIYNNAPDFLKTPFEPILNATGLITETTGGDSGTVTGNITTTVTTSTNTGVVTSTEIAPSASVAPAGDSGGGITGFFGPLISGIVGVLGGVGTVVIGFFSVLVIAFYWVMLRDKPQQILLTTIPPHRREYAKEVLEELALKIGGYIRGELFLGLIIGTVTFIGLFFLGVKYAVVLAVLAGITELIPTIGPIIGAIPALAVAFAFGGVDLGLKVLVLYFLIQQAENAIVVPRVMGAAVDLPPLLVLTAVLVWGSLFGLLGAILAVPITAIITVLFNRIALPYLQQRAQEAG